MNSKDLIEACDILIKLKQEFSTEEAKLSEISGEHAVKIDELDQQITTFRRNEDVDFRVFSPRTNVSGGTSDKIKVLEDEKKALEIIEKEFGIKARYDSLERCILVSAGNSADPADINAALCRNGIRVSELVMKKDDLESFVIGLMQGGEENVKTA